MTTYELITQWQSKAGCTHTQDAAFRLWMQLIDHLSSEQRCELRIAWSHAIIGEGRAELDRVSERVKRELRTTQ